MKWQLLIGAVLVFVAGTPLFITPTQTATSFVWTIKPPLLTAVFLGASYWASFFLGFLASRETAWARARIAVPAAFLFTVLTLLATLLHLDRFHLGSSDPQAATFTWLWMLVYAGVPISLTFVLIHQCRGRAEDPPREQPLSSGFRAAFAVLGAVLLAAGVALFLAPQATGPYWAWTLTPLTARAIAAWLVAIGMGAAHIAYENDFVRVRPALVFLALLGALQAVALARYPNDFAWHEPRGWAYLAVLTVVFGLGVYGWLRAAKPPAGR
jgi:hypothetical protein